MFILPATLHHKPVNMADLPCIGSTSLLWIVFFGLFTAIPGLLQAQNSDQVVMQVRAIVTGQAVKSHVQGLEFRIELTDSNTRLDLPPDSPSAADIRIESTPGNLYSISIPDTVFLYSDRDSLVLSQLQLLKTDGTGSDTARELTPEDCSQLSIPESGTLVLRIGGSVKADGQEPGLYRGMIPISASCFD